VTTVARGHAILATKRALPLTWAGLPPAKIHLKPRVVILTAVLLPAMNGIPDCSATVLAAKVTEEAYDPWIATTCSSPGSHQLAWRTHSITSSARASSEIGGSSPSAPRHCGLPPLLLHSDRNFLRTLPCRPLALA
jgi:hypothetical protein